MLLVSLLLMAMDCCLGAPAGREVYRMPQSALKALSDRGTVVLEAALTSALSALELATSERSQAEAVCRDCVPCLFQDCGQRTGPCSSLDGTLAEPSCDVITKAQKVPEEGERSWALSQACGYYRRRCPPGETEKEACVRIMGESCSARVLQCSLLNTMQNLEPATQTRTQAVCGQRLSAVQNVTQPRSRIVGGSPASPGSWPWLVNLQLDGGLMCGGVLVDSSWVVTAAHCFAGSRSDSYWTAVVGEFDITKTDPDEQVLKVNRIISHPKFNPKTFNNDIALVELTSPVVLSDRVTPVCLPSGLEPPTGSPCLVAGWGSLYEDGPSADVVMEAKVPLLPQSTCKSSLGKELVTNTMLCAGYLSGGIDSCQGDSGGPLIYQDRMSGRFQLHGITSWGDGCGEKGKPGVYTRVSAFSDWILAEIQKSFGSREPTCPELLKTSELSEEQQRSEFVSLCRFYAHTCPPSQGAAACNRLVEEKCRSRFKKCQLRSFLQTLLDLLQRAEDYIRDKVDLTFFTQTLPQLVEHIYSTAFTAKERERREIPQETEQVWGAVRSGSEETGPGLFQKVGPLVADWENYLRGIAVELDTQTHGQTDGSKPLSQEESLFLQAEDPSLHQLEGKYQTIISALHSKLDSRPAPPILHLNTALLQENSPNIHAVPTEESPTSFPLQGSESLTALISEIRKFGTQNEMATEDAEISVTSFEEDTFSDPTPVSSIETTDWLNEAVTEQTTLQRLFPSLSTIGSTMSPIATTFDSRQTLLPGSPSLQLSLDHRRRRSLRKRQIPGVKACPGVAESTQQVSGIRDTYKWILGIPTKNLHMNFQELLVDLSSKNDRGLYEARVRAVVGGRPLTFYSLVGLENESFYRSMPRIIALALDALKT
ncbi:serine protease 56 [Salmo trutta]|uniref:Serine protease 56-like n=1 Tax=Salmo trutta TaxID=8032 RepID=A0A673YSD8_SALTR|nr:serine protease 56-like [Salmo trutta]